MESEGKAAEMNEREKQERAGVFRWPAGESQRQARLAEKRRYSSSRPLCEPDSESTEGRSLNKGSHAAGPAPEKLTL